MNKKIFLIILLVILFGVAGFYILQNIKNQTSKTVQNKESQNGNDAGIVVEGEGSYKIKKIDMPKNSDNFDKITAPDLGKSVERLPAVDEVTYQVYSQKLKEVTERLKSNKYSLEDWLILGIYRKTLGDYKEAEKIWTYAGLAWPQNSTSFQNLGELYAYYLKDNQKAEQNYKKAIENGPEQIYIYRNFADFYRYVLKDTAKAKAILEQGIIANPGATSLDLQNLLKSI